MMAIAVTSQLAASSGQASAESARPAAAQGGRNLPENGKDSPPSREAMPVRAAAEAARAIQEYLSKSRSELQFQVDEGSGRTIVRVVDAATGELIRQIPCEEVVRLAEELRQGSLHLLSDLA